MSSMPELPEVETVRSGLERLLENHPSISKVTLHRGDIRFKIPRELPEKLRSQRITSVRRRAKYLLFDTPAGSLLSHLGMTGSWRITSSEKFEKHDHVSIEFSDGRHLVFRDPRRFGLVDLVLPSQEAQHPRLKNLGVEPLDEDAFTGQWLFDVSRKRKTAVKTLIMDQRRVVGIGNIYASEALFRAGVKPTKISGRLTLEECGQIVASSCDVLLTAIRAGGSSIRDYKNASGEAGDFQSQHLVYDRAGEFCRVCGTVIKQKVIGGRSTFWCPTCQR